MVKDYYKAIENCDAKDLMATVPKDYLKELMDDNDLSRKELTNDVQDYLTNTMTNTTTSRSPLRTRKSWTRTTSPTTSTLRMPAIWK
ncbi:MAG: hypothetical protein ACLTXT_03495 [Ruminococcus callidus]